MVDLGMIDRCIMCIGTKHKCDLESSFFFLGSFLDLQFFLKLYS